MSIAIPGFTSTTPPTTTSNSNGTGVNSLSSSDFMNLMLTQLEQQDPLNPTDSNQMLTQLSQISNLQANNAMQTSLSSLTLQQSIGAGGNLMGKNITGIDSAQQPNHRKRHQCPNQKQQCLSRPRHGQQPRSDVQRPQHQSCKFNPHQQPGEHYRQ